MGVGVLISLGKGGEFLLSRTTIYNLRPLAVDYLSII